MEGPACQPPSFRQALRFWGLLGCLSFGGPAGQIALMHSEVVERRHWVSQARFQHALGFCMVLPGPEAQQLATYLGWLMHGRWGGIAAGLLFVLPGFLALSGLAWLLMAQGHVPAVAGLFQGLAPAAVALVVLAGWRMARKALGQGPKPGWAWAIATLACLNQMLGGLSFALVIALAGLLGFALWGRSATAPRTDSHARPPEAEGSSAQTHAKPWRLLAAGLALWALPMGLLWWALGRSHPFAQMGEFFTQAALLTFGGAYAVLPYVHHGAVEVHGWLSTSQMMTGLALGESTPGPLIMVVSFVGFLGGYQMPPEFAVSGLGAAMAGWMGSAVATYFTFLPSFLFILVGAPWVERSRGLAAMQGPLRAVAAAVVGVMVSFALFLAQHALWPQGWSAGPNLQALLWALVAGLALWRWPRHLPWVLLFSALLGLGLGLEA
jgi:chromate transporter